MRRKNKLIHAIYHFKAENTDLLRVNFGQNVEPKSVIYNRFHIQMILYNISQKELEWIRFFGKNHIQPLKIYYEDLIENYSETLSKICGFLGVKLPNDFQFPAPPLQKQADEESEAFHHRFQKNPKWHENLSIFLLMPTYKLLNLYLKRFLFLKNDVFYIFLRQNRLIYCVLKPIYSFFLLKNTYFKNED